VIEQQEWVGVGYRQRAGKDATDGNTGAFSTRVCLDDLGDGPRSRAGDVGSRDSGQDEGVVNGDRGHGDQLLSVNGFQATAT
jgi:hypothetical protein